MGIDEQRGVNASTEASKEGRACKEEKYKLAAAEAKEKWQKAKSEFTPAEVAGQQKAAEYDRLWQTTGEEKYRRLHHAEVDRVVASLENRGEIRGGAERK